MYHLFVNGIPKAQPRPRMASNNHVYNPPAADAWKAEVKAAFLQCRRDTITAAVRLRVNFFMSRPKSMKAGTIENVPHVKKPDLDNLLKAVMDAMTEARVWKDDALVYETEAKKWYARDKTGAQIIVETEM
jgi:Holliday junction resolvase RusA-like endonuclease